MLRDASAIVGIAQSEFVREIGRPEDETAYEVSRAALQEAGIDSAEVDGIFHVEGQAGGAPLLARRLGAHNLRSWASASGGGGAACAPVVLAVQAIATGQCQVAVAYRARNRGTVGGRIRIVGPHTTLDLAEG